ncbi:bactericidal permeability-increasing protein [Rutstroemia sp. NJR-2017a BBW]|nr:bactericidal permeability-increasing protein [Rutstroemia sp. NJR-2017a BBW]
MSSCFGSRKSGRGDTQPLLPQYEDDTSLQRTVHQKLHTYQMLKALSKGYMPSTDQAIVNLRTLLASDVLNPENPELTDSGRKLIKFSKQWLTDFIELLRHKNDGDQIQDFIWFLIHSRISVNATDIVERATATRAKADASATYASIKTVGSLLLTNSDFRIFLSDLNTIGRQVFADTAKTVSAVAEDAAKEIEPSTSENQAMKNPGHERSEPIPVEDLQAEVSDVAKVVTNGLKKTGQEAGASLKENITGEQKETLKRRLKQAVMKLNKRNDYSDSVNTIGLLIQRYAKVYSRAVDKTINTVTDDVETNEELDRAVKNGWSLISSFGDKSAWKKLEESFNKVLGHSQKDPEFENLMGELAKSIQEMLTDPNFFDAATDKIGELKEKSEKVGTESPLRKDIDDLLRQARITLDSVFNDEDISKLLDTSFKIWTVLNPLNKQSNTELFTDVSTVLIPLFISAIQYIPIPRLEISVPEIDLLLENLILEPGRTINHTSFLPYRLKIETYNDLSIHKARFRTFSKVTSMVTVKVQGLSIRADEVGFWLRAHKGLFWLADQGIASFELDERGIDIEFDVEIGHNQLEKILTLKDTRVKIHKLSYNLRQSKFACLAWLLKPLLRPVLRKTLEYQLSTSISEFFHAANRELLFARERLRATRISSPDDIMTFVRAVITRLTPPDDPDLYVGLGVQGGAKKKGNVFRGVYAPGSVVKVWEEEGRRAGEVVEDEAVRGWRNEIFDVQGRSNMMGW